MASIIVMTGTQKGDYYPLGRRTNVIGRDEALPVQILDDRQPPTARIPRLGELPARKLRIVPEPVRAAIPRDLVRRNERRRYGIAEPFHVVHQLLPVHGTS